jgi:hypothetical protein
MEHLARPGSKYIYKAFEAVASYNGRRLTRTDEMDPIFKPGAAENQV